MANKIDLIVKYSEDAFDEVYRADSRIGLLDGNTKDMVFTGAKTVKIPKWNSGGMYNYGRANNPNNQSGNFSQGTQHGSGYGYQISDMGYEWETFTLAIDRAVQYRVDMFDDEETAKTLVARGSTQVNKQVLIPEIDAYSFAKIAGSAGKVLTGTISDAATSPVEALNSALLWLEENEVSTEDVIGFVSPKFKEALRNTSKNGLVKPLLQGEFEKNIKFSIEEYEGVKLVSVPPRRFMTNIILDDGFYRPGTAADANTTYGEGSNPYKVTGASEAIDFLLVQKSAVYHIVKYNKIKVFGPDVVQDYDGYKINVHVYHDVFVPDNKRLAVVLHTGGFDSAVAENISLTVTKTADNKLASATILPGSTKTNGKLYLAAVTSEAAAGITVGGNMPESPVEIAIGGALTASKDNYVYVADTLGKKVLAIAAKISL